LVVLIDNAGMELVEFGAALAPDAVAGAGIREEIAFVGGVDEHLSAVFLDSVRRPVGNAYGCDALAAARHLLEAASVADADARLSRHHFVEGSFGDAWLVVVAVPAELHLLRALPVPGNVAAADVFDELTKESADRCARFDVGFSQAARGHAAQMAVILEQGDR